MKCQGNFIFKTLTHRNADELMSNGDINERKFKIDDKETAIINGLKTLKAYQEIVINFEVTLYASRVTLDIVDIEYEN